MGGSAVSAIGILYWFYWVVAIVVMVRVILRNHDTVKTLAWIMVFISIPFIGLLLYFFFGRDTRRKRMAGRRFMAQIKLHSAPRSGDGAIAMVMPEYQSLATFFENVSSAPLLTFDGAEVISDTHIFAERLFEMISVAEEHIHLQF